MESFDFASGLMPGRRVGLSRSWSVSPAKEECKMMSVTTLALFGNLGTMELIIILVVGLLLFGKRLPEVGKSLGKGIVEFKKGLKGVEDDVDNASRANTQVSRELPPPAVDDRRVGRAENAAPSQQTQG
jgi:sec-independent protein translocase protein TatA